MTSVHGCQDQAQCPEGKGIKDPSRLKHLRGLILCGVGFCALAGAISFTPTQAERFGHADAYSVLAGLSPAAQLYINPGRYDDSAETAEDLRRRSEERLKKRFEEREAGLWDAEDGLGKEDYQEAVDPEIKQAVAEVDVLGDDGSPYAAEGSDVHGGQGAGTHGGPASDGSPTGGSEGSRRQGGTGGGMGGGMGGVGGGMGGGVPIGVLEGTPVGEALPIIADEEGGEEPSGRLPKTGEVEVPDNPLPPKGYDDPLTGGEVPLPGAVLLFPLGAALFFRNRRAQKSA